MHHSDTIREEVSYYPVYTLKCKSCDGEEALVEKLHSATKRNWLSATVAHSQILLYVHIEVSQFQTLQISETNIITVLTIFQQLYWTYLSKTLEHHAVTTTGIPATCKMHRAGVHLNFKYKLH